MEVGGRITLDEGRMQAKWRCECPDFECALCCTMWRRHLAHSSSASYSTSDSSVAAMPLVVVLVLGSGGQWPEFQSERESMFTEAVAARCVSVIVCV